MSNVRRHAPRPHMARGQHDDESNQCRGNRAEYCVGSVGGLGSTQGSAKDQKLSGTIASSKRMADGKEWTTANLNVNTSSSYCYDDAEPYCRRYGRLYTWESAQRGCQSLGDRWRLPTDDEWRQMAKDYGGVGNDSPDKGKAAYTALLSGGTSGFNAVLGGIAPLMESTTGGRSRILLDAVRKRSDHRTVL
jgi:Fibrobacter succinogenes major domain (Fib_succ_major)